jgi:hypothetical protein
MASTITLAGTVAATTPLLGYRPLAFAGLATPIYEPALTMANMVKLAMLGAPFSWRWNRLGSAPTMFTCVPTQAAPTDYPEAITNFGWIEWAAVNNLDAVNPLWVPMTRVEALAIAEETGVPRSIAAQYDNGSGQITFRVMPSPDQAYVVQMDIQQKASLFNTATNPLTQTWSPIPDEFSDIYTWGFQALSLALNGDPRFAEYNQKFVSGLLARHSGLNETQITDFLNVWHSIGGGQEQLMEKLRQGIQARGV